MENEIMISKIENLDPNISRNLIAIKDDVLLFWNGSLNAYQLDSSNKIAKNAIINLTETPSFTVTNITLNWKGSNLALIGPRGLAIVDLPLNLERIFHDQHKQQIAPCSCTQLGKKLFYDQSIRNLQTRWHPSSDTHLIVLTNNNHLNLFDTIDQLDEKKSFPILNASSLNSSSNRIALTNAFGEGIVSFDFGPSLITASKNETLPELANIFPIFCLTGDGDIYMMYFSLAEEHISNRVFGPLPIKPMCDDDYGFDSCSIMCVDHESTFIVVATLSGKIYHFIALEEETDNSRNGLLESQEFEFYTLNRTRIAVPSITLYLTDAIHIDFSTLNPEQYDLAAADTVSLDNTRFLTLYPHLLDPRRYFVVHRFGVHYVHCTLFEEYLNNQQISDKHGSIVECIYSTNLRNNDALFPVGYTSTMKNGLSLSVMFNNGKVIFKNSAMLRMSKSPLKTEDKLDSSSNRFLVPKMDDPHKNRIINEVRDILRKTANIPKFVGPEMEQKSQLTEKDLLMLKQIIEIFKSQYFAKFLLAKGLLESVWQAHNQSYSELRERYLTLDERMKKIRDQFPELVRKSDDILAKKAELSDRTVKLYNNTIQSNPGILKQNNQLNNHLNEYSAKIPKFRHDIEVLKKNFSLMKKDIIKARLKPAKPNAMDYEKICNILNKHEKDIKELESLFDQ